MSSIATFTRLPKTSLTGLRNAATPKKGFFGGSKDVFHAYLEKHGKEVAQYDWSGYILATLLPFLDEHDIQLMNSEEDELSTFLCQARQASCFILTRSHKRYLDRLTPDTFSEEVLRKYYNEFNETSEDEIGKAMLDGVASFRQSLESIDDDSVVLFMVG